MIQKGSKINLKKESWRSKLTHKIWSVEVQYFNFDSIDVEAYSDSLPMQDAYFILFVLLLRIQILMLLKQNVSVLPHSTDFGYYIFSRFDWSVPHIHQKFYLPCKS